MAFWKNGEPIELSKTEQKLLKILAQNIGRTMSRNLLIDRVWSDGAEFVEENGRFVMPVTVRLNHAIADGYLVAKVFKLLEEEIGKFTNR